MNGTRQLNCAYANTPNFEWVCMAGCCYIIHFFSLSLHSLATFKCTMKSG